MVQVLPSPFVGWGIRDLELTVRVIAGVTNVQGSD